MPEDTDKPPHSASAAVDLRTSIDQDWALVRDLIQKSEDLEAAAAEASTSFAQSPEQPPPVPEPEPDPASAAKRRIRLPALRVPNLRFPRPKRPSKRGVWIAGLGVFLAALILRPGLMLSLLVLTICLAVALCAALGPERLGPVLLRLHQRLQVRAPERADQMLRFVAMIVQILPPRWRYGFELPETPATHDSKNDIAFERLSRMAAER
ncbi:MAG: hypothetical protein AAGA38_00890 [Pseudomonadota bacterium]